MNQLPDSDPGRRRFSDDRGFIMIEVLVSAVILITVSLAVFFTLDKADAAAGNQQKRAIAGNLGQAELERLRALPVEDIAALPASYDIIRGGQKYTVKTVAKWVTDGSDEPQCNTRTGGLDYLRTTVSMTWKDMGNAKPISFTSLYTPSAGAGGGNTGSASILLTDRNGVGVPNVTVGLHGPKDYSGSTNVNGCVVFGFIPASTDYTLTFGRAGYVNGQSQTSVSDKVTVTAGQTTKLQYDFDSGGFTAATFKTRVASRNPVEFDTFPLRAQLFNALQPVGPVSLQVNPDTGGPKAFFNGAATPIFPFTSPYSIFAGNCAANAIPSSNPYAKYVNISPGSMQNAGQVNVPALDVTVVGTAGAKVAGAIVQYDPGCTPIYQRTTRADGMLDDPGFPYSTNARVCAMNATRHAVIASVANTNVANGTAITLNLVADQLPSKTYSGGTSNGLTSCF